MKKSFSARRVPRKIGQDDDETPSSGDAGGGEAGSETALQRPTVKPRKSSALRTSLRASATEDDEDDSSEAKIVAPKKANLSRVAVQRNALKRSSMLGAPPVSRQTEDDDDRPSYSAASLQELKNSTPTTPRDFASPDSRPDVDDVSSGTRELDLSSNFSSALAPSAIPSAMEIAEKKARRARLAKEQAADEFISLDPDDPSLDNEEDLDENVTRDASGRLILKPKDKDKYGQASSRLVREDEDVLENFEEFTEPTSQLSFSRNSEAEALRSRKREIADQIAEAQAGDQFGTGDGSDDDSDDASDDSEKARNAAFEAAQTRHGISASARHHHRSRDDDDPPRPRTPPKITPLPTLDAAVARLRTRLAEMQTLRSQQLRDMEALQREKIRLGEEEIRIQKALRETGEKFAVLRREKGIEGSGAAGKNGEVAEALVRVGGEATPAGESTPGRDGPIGLGYGGTIGHGTSRGASTDVESDVDGGGRGLGYGGGGLGYGGGGRGLGSLGSSALAEPAEHPSTSLREEEDGSDGGMDTE